MTSDHPDATTAQPDAASGAESRPVSTFADAPEQTASDEVEPLEAEPQLVLPVFEGPLDLLLSLIERQELDITEVSLLAVTEQYLAQLRNHEQMNLSALAEFVAVGARLLLLKSRALLPREDQPEQDDVLEEDDPAALVAALQEYRRYRRAAEHLATLEEEHRSAYRREATPPETPLPTGLDEVTLDALADLFRQVLERIPEEEPAPTVVREPVRLRDRIRALVERLAVEDRVSFRGLIERAETRLEVVIDFLAVLELIKANYLRAEQQEAFSDIDLVRIEGAQPPPYAELAKDFDDV